MISPEASGSLDVYSFGSQENKELECRTEWHERYTGRCLVLEYPEI